MGLAVTRATVQAVALAVPGVRHVEIEEPDLGTGPVSLADFWVRIRVWGDEGAAEAVRDALEDGDHRPMGVEFRVVQVLGDEPPLEVGAVLGGGP